jgi:formiminoglutamase
VNSIDEAVEGLVKAIVVAGKIPIVIGGGHNNAYPCLKGAAKGLHQAGLVPLPQINCINLAPNAGYQPEEGRHSGNPYRYADEDGFLQKYCAVGIQEDSLQQNVWMDIVNNPFMDCITFEDIFVRGKRSFVQAVEHAVGFTDDSYTGIDLNMRVVQQMGVPDSLPHGGIAVSHARQYVTIAGNVAKPAYLHISEAGEQSGKLLAHLVTDFVKAVEEIND